MIMRNLILAASLLAAATADAKPHKVVVIDFDGLPRNVADTGRSNVMALLGAEYEMVPTKKWELARAKAPGRGPSQWQQAAKSSGVDAVIEGWVNTEGRHHTLTVQVRDAVSGNEIDSVSVQIGDKGLSQEVQKSLNQQLDDILGWVDADSTSEDVKDDLPDVRTIGAKTFKPRVDDEAESDRGYDRDSERRPSHSRRPKSLKHVYNDDDSDRDRDDDRRSDDRREHRSSRNDDRDRDRDDDRRSDDRRDDDRRPDKERSAAPTLKAVAALDPTDVKNTGDLLTFFPGDSKEADVVAASKAPRVMTPAPKYFLEGGAFVSSRGMNFIHNPPDSVQGTPDYPAQGLAGIAIQGAIYPYPINKLDNDPSGIGFSFGIQKSIGSMFSSYDPDANTYGDYTIDNTAYNGAIHYRYPTDMLIVDADVSYGKFGYAIEGLGGGVQIPDVDYTYIGLGGTVDLKVTDRTRAGFGAHYMYILDAGDVSDETWYGSGSATGLDLEAHFQIPISDMLFVRAMLDYKRVSMDFEQSGDVSSGLEIGTITDSTIGGQAMIGVQF